MNAWKKDFQHSRNATGLDCKKMKAEVTWTFHFVFAVAAVAGVKSLQSKYLELSFVILQALLRVWRLSYGRF